MKYINSYKLNEILKENENLNTHYEDLDINFRYDLSDGINKVTQNSKQKAFGVNIDNVEHVITIDVYNDSSYPYILTERNSPSIEILNSEKVIHSVLKEKERVNKIISEKSQNNDKGPFGKYENLNKDFSEKVEKEVKNHLKSFNNTVVESLKNIANTNDSNSFNDLVSLKEQKISELSSQFTNTFNKIYEDIKDTFQENIKKENSESLRAILIERTQRLEKKAEEERIKNDLIDLSNNTQLLEKFNYYPSISIDSKKSELTFTAFNSDNKEEFKAILPLKDIEVEYFNPDYGRDDYFQYFILDKDGINNISKKDQEKYYHALTVIEDSFLYSKNDEAEMGYISSNMIDPLGDKEEGLKIEGKFELSKAMVANYNDKSYLEYVNDEIKEKFKSTKNKIKP